MCVCLLFCFVAWIMRLFCAHLLAEQCTNKAKWTLHLNKVVTHTAYLACKSTRKNEKERELKNRFNLNKINIIVQFLLITLSQACSLTEKCRLKISFKIWIKNVELIKCRFSSNPSSPPKYGHEDQWNNVKIKDFFCSLFSYSRAFFFYQLQLGSHEKKNTDWFLTREEIFALLKFTSHFCGTPANLITNIGENNEVQKPPKVFSFIESQSMDFAPEIKVRFNVSA